MDKWPFQIGEELTRAQISDEVGGKRQGGITAAGPKNLWDKSVLIFSDPSAAEIYGYAYDGWVNSNKIFQYTGEGQIGDQKWTHGNKTLLNAIPEDSQGRRRIHEFKNPRPGGDTNKEQIPVWEDVLPVRVFVKVGQKDGSQTGLHLYIGKFTPDWEWPWFYAQALDRQKFLRQVFVFRLLPVGEVIVRPEDSSENPAQVETTFKEIPLVSQSKETEIEKTHKTEFQVSGKETTTGQRKESELRDEYIAHLESIGHEIVGSEITPHSQAKTYKVDLYDKTTEELCEVKSSAVSEKIWHAIGQVLFYAHHLKNEPKTVSILVPSRPSEDLLELITKLGIVCIYKSNNSFERVEPDEYKHT